MKGKNLMTRKYSLPALTIIGLLVLWEAFVRITDTPLYVLPAPVKILQTLFLEFPVLWRHSLVTLGETIIGILIAVVVGIVLAILMDAFETMKAAIYPILVVSQTIPVIVLAPIFIIYLGFGLAPKILTVVLMCFFPIVVSFSDGMAQVDQNQVNLIRAFGAGKLQLYTLIKLHAAAPSLFSGLKVAATYSITGAVVGEWLTSDQGLGYYMLRVKNGFMLDKVFACLLVVIILSLLMNGAVRLLKYILFPHLRKSQTT